ncbi:sugar transferase [Algoriphagus sp. H41]|uniref:Sugar transferase n=1 Tax=Algoriphagus oliviformis TaxID=2811231 RepID=A0ABS3C8L2_9BACT|nr:sugar transferase [Algoriphagus oliviformis]
MANYLRQKFGNFDFYISSPVRVHEDQEAIVSPKLNWVNLSVKRLIDLFLCTLFMLVIGWWLFLIVALLIKLDSKGPVFFKQEREGINDSRFNCYKFRSMRVNDEADRKMATKDDPRITKVGRVLRKTSIDELPQILNVIYGNMAIVGPRPHIVVQNREYAEQIDGYRNRHLVKPGITGLAQAKGYRGGTQLPNSIYFRYKLDMYYVKNWSVVMDLRIIAMTIKSVLTDTENAY